MTIYIKNDDQEIIAVTLSHGDFNENLYMANLEDTEAFSHGDEDDIELWLVDPTIGSYDTADGHNQKLWFYPDPNKQGHWIRHNTYVEYENFKTTISI